MVANTQETMNKMFDSMNDTFKQTMNAFGSFQESCFKTMREPVKTPTGFNASPFGFDAFTTNFTKNWVPFMERSVQNFTETCNKTFENGFQAAKNASQTSEKTDPVADTQKAFDATVKAFNANMDTMGKAFSRNTENCSKLMQSNWCMPGTDKACDTMSGDSARCETKGASKGQTK